VITLNYTQLSLFSHDDANQELNSPLKNQDAERKIVTSDISERIINEFDIIQIPFIGCNYDMIYHQINEILPSEEINFNEFGLEKNIACEVICAAICHQMNWDFLRKVVFDKTKINIDWLNGEILSNISVSVVKEMLKSYSKPERIRAEERTKLLREVGKMVGRIGSYSDIFLDNEMNILPYERIRAHLLSCLTFSKDPNEKKLQLLLQKLSNIKQLKGLGKYYKPAIDYHLIRCYLRRGLILPKTQYAENFIINSAIQRKESTVGAMRQLCCELIEQICWFTSLDISSVNLVEWHMGRSVCIQGKPDCFLKSKDAAWLKVKFSRCPFYDNCVACQYKKEYLTIQEPTYDGTSY